MSRCLPHPISRETITGAHIVQKEECHFDQEKLTFVHTILNSIG
ncbi:T3SS effector NleG family protein [Citrobacter braakii]